MMSIICQASSTVQGYLPLILFETEVGEIPSASATSRCSHPTAWSAPRSRRWRVRPPGLLIYFFVKVHTFLFSPPRRWGGLLTVRPCPYIMMSHRHWGLSRWALAGVMSPWGVAAPRGFFFTRPAEPSGRVSLALPPVSSSRYCRWPIPRSRLTGVRAVGAPSGARGCGGVLQGVAFEM